MIGLIPIGQMFQALHQRFRAHVWKSEWSARRKLATCGFPTGGFRAEAIALSGSNVAQILPLPT